MGDKDLIKPLLARAGQVFFGRVRMKPGKPLTFATLPLEDAPTPASAAATAALAAGGGATAAATGAGAASDEPSRRMLVFGLPGNPVSSFVCFNLVVLPALRKMSGWANPMLRRVRVRITSDLKLDPERPEYHRATICYGSCPAASPGSQAASTQLPGGGASAPSPGEEPVWYAVSTGNQISSRLLSARSANALLELPQRAGVLAAGSEVSALIIDDLGRMPVPGEVPVTEGFA